MGARLRCASATIATMRASSVSDPTRYAPPVVITNASEGPAYGVALLAGVGTGVWKSVEEACKSSIKQVEKVMPNKKSAAFYERHYAVYRKLYFDLKDRFGEMAALL